MKTMRQDFAHAVALRRRKHDLGEMTNEIAGHIPGMWTRSSESDFWNWFGGEIESVMRNAADMDERIRLRDRLLVALSRAGLPQPPPTVPWNS